LFLIPLDYQRDRERKNTKKEGLASKNAGKEGPLGFKETGMSLEGCKEEGNENGVWWKEGVAPRAAKAKIDRHRKGGRKNNRSQKTLFPQFQGTKPDQGKGPRIS